MDNFDRRKFAEELKQLAACARNSDPDYSAFAAFHHKYFFNPPADVEKVIQFEQKYNVTIPEAYSAYLTMVGNGGPGPGYGVYSLEKLEEYNSCFLREYNEDVFINDQLTKEIWSETVAKLENANGDAYDKLLASIMSGAIEIGTFGCGLSILLMLRGSEKGKIVYFDWEMNPDVLPVLKDVTFEHWIIDYFQKVICGEAI